MSNEKLYSSITLEEVKAQMAVGALKAPKEVAAVVKITNDPQLIKWALTSNYYNIRIAAVKHPYCEFGQVIRACLSDESKTVREAARQVIKIRQEELNHFFHLLQNYPQLSFSFATIQKDIFQVVDENVNKEFDLDDDCPF